MSSMGRSSSTQQQPDAAGDGTNIVIEERQNGHGGGAGGGGGSGGGTGGTGGSSRKANVIMNCFKASNCKVIIGNGTPGPSPKAPKKKESSQLKPSQWPGFAERRTG